MDQLIFEWFQSIHNSILDTMFRDITAFGGVTCTLLLMLFSSIVLAKQGYSSVIPANFRVFLALTIIIAAIKIGVGRERPIHPADLLALEVFVPAPNTYSFPSGHTAMSVFVYGMLAILGGRFFPIIRNFLLYCAIGFPVLIGISRLYLGAHWATDVIAGYVIGWMAVWVWHEYAKEELDKINECYV